MLKRGLKILLTTLCTILLIVLSYCLYVIIDYDRLDDNLLLNINNNQESLVEINKEYKIITYNIGFGAYEDDFSFFMDGGKYSRAISKERLITNMNNIENFLKEQKSDFYLIQEVDEQSSRSYKINEKQQLIDSFNNYTNIWSQNWDSSYLFYPIFSPHGKVKTGLLTLTKYNSYNAIRKSLPVENTIMKYFDLDRCYTKSYYKINEETNLVLYNVHLSAYSSDGKIAEEQLKLLINDMQEEYNKNNYILCGGDFNKDLSGDSEKYFGYSSKGYTWAQPLPKDIFDDTNLSLIFAYDEILKTPSCRNADAPYNENQFVFTVDGFIVSDNIEIISSKVIDLKFEYSDHNPVEMLFKLK